MSSGNLELRIIAELLDWTEKEAEAGFKWIRLMSRFKFDAYSDFVAGARFTGSLIQWLRNLDQEDRRPAYEFMRSHLQYVSSVEMRRLVEAFYPRVIEPVLVHRAAKATGVNPYEIMANPQGSEDFNCLLQSTLIVGMSEGAHLDSLRRANMGILTHERMLPSVEMDKQKWKDVFADTFKNKFPEESAFSSIVLVDDFVGSGTTFFREDEKAVDGFKGKLVKLLRGLPDQDDDWRLADEVVIYVHHYIGSLDARDNLYRLKPAAEGLLQKKLGNKVSIEFSFGWLLPKEIKVDGTETVLKRLVEKYYSKDIETDHNTAGGGTSKDIKWGYKECGLTLVLEHNTPNNSLPLIWAYSDGAGGGRAMRPLFQRRQRHV